MVTGKTREGVLISNQFINAMKTSFKNHNMPIHQEGWIFILIGIIITLFFGYLSLYSCIITVPITIFVCAFFRNPNRKISSNKLAIVSPADGRVILIGEVPLPNELKKSVKKTAKPFTRISVFMNVFNVHVNRSPVEGKIQSKLYTKGKFFNASFDKASAENERMSYIINEKQGNQIVVVQIAGLIARRIVSWKSAKSSVKKGERFGLIRFGSRVDIYVPSTVKLNVSIGQKVSAGSDILAYFKA